MLFTIVFQRLKSFIMEPDSLKTVPMICPQCKAVETAAVDFEEPSETTIIELSCPQCLDADDSLSIEAVYRNKDGTNLV